MAGSRLAATRGSTPWLSLSAKYFPRSLINSLPILILLVAAGLRFHALGRDARFHPDEALFATFARAAALNGRWLLPGPLDKPPLSLYAEALAMIPFVDASNPNLLQLDIYRGEFAARLPGTFASIALVAVTFALARSLYRERMTARIAMLLVALSPFAIAFSATAFTDGLMLLFMTASVWTVATGRWRAAGILLALGVGCKFQALFYLPLVAAVRWTVTKQGEAAKSGAASLAPTKRPARRVGPVVSLTLPLVIAAVVLAVWDTARAQPTGLWALNAANNDPGRLIRLDELGPRLQAWLAHGAALLGPPPVTWGLLGLGGIAAAWRWQRPTRRPRRRLRVDGVLLGFAAGYVGLHWLVAVNTYDRYLLPLLPITALLAARGVGWAITMVSGRGTPTGTAAAIRSVFVVVVLTLVLLPAAMGASNGAAPVGGDRGEHDGIDTLADWLNRRTLGAIVYDHWLGWELGYYLGEWTDKRRVYYPTPDALAEDALRQPDPAPRYFVTPHDVALDAWLTALRTAGFRDALAYRSETFVVYRLLPPWATDS